MTGRGFGLRWKKKRTRLSGKDTNRAPGAARQPGPGALQQREQLVRSLRAEGKSRVEVADALRQPYRFNARVALRYAHGWSQRQAADEWNQRWPDELKTFKNFSYWEQWPSSTGHIPTFDNLSKLAELYECAVSDLLVDLPDFRHRDTTSSTQTAALTMSKSDVELAVPSDFAVWATATDLALPDTFVAMLMQYLGSGVCAVQ